MSSEKNQQEEMSSHYESFLSMLLNPEERETGYFMFAQEQELEPAVYDKLSTLLDSKDTSLRTAAIISLSGKTNLPATLGQKILNLASDQNDDVKIAVLQMAEDLGAVCETLVEKTCQLILSSKNSNFRVKALHALLSWTFKSKKTQEIFLSFLKSSENEEKIYAADNSGDFFDTHLDIKIDNIILALHYILKNDSDHKVLEAVASAILKVDGYDLDRKAKATGGELSVFDIESKFKNIVDEAYTYAREARDRADEAEKILESQPVVIAAGDLKATGVLWSKAQRRIRSYLADEAEGVNSLDLKPIIRAREELEAALKVMEDSGLGLGTFHYVYCDLHLACLLLKDYKAAEIALDNAERHLSGEPYPLVQLLRGEFILKHGQDEEAAKVLLKQAFDESQGEVIQYARNPNKVLKTIGKKLE